LHFAFCVHSQFGIRNSEFTAPPADAWHNRPRFVSELLDISDGTVKNHISNLLSKLGVRDRTRAVLKAIDLGVI
jgi:hypothetical protein